MYTLKNLAEDGYIMGLPTIGEVAEHMRLHYDAYFMIEGAEREMAMFDDMVEGHEDESIFKYLTDADKKRMDDELEKAMNEGPKNSGGFDENEGEEGEQENKHF